MADIFLSAAEQKRSKRELELQSGITPEEKRRTEIKAGVITGCSGLGVAIVLLPDARNNFERRPEALTKYLAAYGLRV